MQTPIFTPRLITAAVTPFTPDANRIDAAAFQRVLQHLIATGSEGILVHGTTGESPTLSLAEKETLHVLAQQAIQAFNADVKLVVGISGNATAQVVGQIARFASGPTPIDAFLVVSPYYNKPTQAGLLAHFSAAIEAANDVPVVLYNIPGRCGVEISPQTMRTLYERYPKQLAGVKQSLVNMDTLSDILALLPPEETGFRVWSGDDSLTLPMLGLGAHGVMSVTSHLTGQTWQRMLNAFFAGDLSAARAAHNEMLPVMRAIAQTTNPILIKLAMAKRLDFAPALRLPLLAEATELEICEHLLAECGHLFPKPAESVRGHLYR